MIIILTFHRVLAGAQQQPEFYTTQAADLEHKLDLLEASGFKALAPDNLFVAAPVGGALTSRRYDQGNYLLTFDDGTRDHYEVVLPLLERRKLKGVFFVPTAKIGREGYLTAEQISAMSRAGQVIGSHSHEHRRMDVLMEEDIRVQLEVAGGMLCELTGRRPEFFAPPGGYMNRLVCEMALESGARGIRTMKWGYNRSLDLTRIECVPVNRFMTEKEFQGVLRFRGMGVKYAAKQVSRRLIPSASYERARNAYFRMLGRN